MDKISARVYVLRSAESLGGQFQGSGGLVHLVPLTFYQFLPNSTRFSTRLKANIQHHIYYLLFIIYIYSASFSKPQLIYG